MKTKLSIFLTALAASTISAMPAQAASFGNEGIIFDEDTTVTFDFLQSNGYWQAEFGVKNLGTGEENILLFEDFRADYAAGHTVDSENLGTAGISVLDTEASFTFLADQEYSLFLKNFDSNADKYVYQYSTTANNGSWLSQGTGGGANGDGTFTISDNDFDSSLNGEVVNGQIRALFQESGANSANIFFEDNTTWGDNDFDDFVVQATIEPTSTPEPATLAGLGVVAAGMFLSRRNKQK
jgi:hypothetical protein